MFRNKRHKAPDQVIRVSGHTFQLYRVYDESQRAYMLDYPNFQERPVYTGGGRPFTLSVQEACPHGQHHEGNGRKPYDCNECAYFQQEAPGDAIGVCLCQALRRPETRNAKEENP